MSDLKIHVEFSGGAELLVEKVKHHDLKLPIDQSNPWSLRRLIAWIRDNLLKVKICACGYHGDQAKIAIFEAETILLLYHVCVCVCVCVCVRVC